MNRVFVNRQAELAFLEQQYHEEGFRLAVLYGRRRVGKTELIRQFLSTKDGIYYLADRRGTLVNARLCAEEAALFFQDMPPAVENFDDIFVYIRQRAGKGKLVVVIDEFSYLVEKDDAIPSVFQRIADTILPDTAIMLILCGSSIGMMEQGVLSYQSPLYGRRTGDWKVAPLTYKDALGFFPRYGFEDRLQAVLLLGGIPAYLQVFDDRLSLWENISTHILTKGGRLYNEVRVILQEELRDPATYLKILESMSKGAAKTVDIAHQSYVEVKDLPKYFHVLQALEYVRRIRPITERKPMSKKTLYRLADNFFAFWFRFVAARQSDLEMGRTDAVLDQIKDGFPAFLGRQFEDFCREFLWTVRLPLAVSHVGPWWDKDKEIDLVCLDESQRQALFVECKWSDLTEQEARRVLAELQEKARFVEWERQKEHFGLIAKKMKGKETLRSEGFVVFDLEDIARVVGQP